MGNPLFRTLTQLAWIAAGAFLLQLMFGALAGALGGFGPCYLLLAPLPILCGALLLHSSFVATRALRAGSIR